MNKLPQSRPPWPNHRSDAPRWLAAAILFLFVVSIAPQAASANDSALLSQVVGSPVSVPAGIVILETKKPKDNSFSVKGRADSNNLVAELMATLSKAPGISNVDLVSSRHNQQGQKEFEISFGRGVTKQSRRLRRPRRKPTQFTDEQIKQLETRKKDLIDSGSHMRLALLSMERHRFLAENSADDESGLTPTYDEFSARSNRNSVGSMSLASHLRGEFSQGRRRWNGNDEFDTLMGTRAIRETLQTESIGEGPRNARNGQMLSINTVPKLQVKSHPWEEMLKTATPVELSEIFTLVPEDNFLVYLGVAARFSSIENALKEITAFGRETMQFGKLLSVREKVSKRLGIEGLEKLESLVDELAFVSEDLDFYPGTNYALILSFKSEILHSAAQHLPGTQSVHGAVGKFYVIATSQQMFDAVKHSHEGTRASMKGAKDFQYMLSLLEERRDGFAYLSESFILKMVSPAYRINAARRNAAINKLEALQYTVFGHRVLSDSWPSTFTDIVDANYIEANAVPSEYSIQDSAIVKNATWGTIYDIHAVSEVPIEFVSKAERDDYGRFRSRYQNFWQRVFDPIAIGFGASDHVFMHVVILPLIDESRYKQLASFAGGAPVEFKAFREPLRLPPLLFFSKFYFDQMLTAFMREDKRKLAALSDEQIKPHVNKEIQTSLGLEDPIDVFEMIGNEMTVGIGTDVPLALSSIADFDAYIGFQLKNRDKFQSFLKQIYQGFYSKFRRQLRGSPFLQLSSTEPLKNNYKDKDFYLIPTGFVNLYWVFHDDFVYFAISQLAINRIIDSIDSAPDLSPNQQRALDFVGAEQNMLALVDFSEFGAVKQRLVSNELDDWRTRNQVRSTFGYLADVAAIGSVISDDARLRELFPLIPNEIAGIPVELKNGAVYLSRGDSRHELSSLSAPKRNSYRHNKNSSEKKIKLASLIDDSWRERATEALSKIAGLSVGTIFDPDKFEARFAIRNPLVEELDPRFKAGASSSGRASSAASLPGKLSMAKDHKQLIIIIALSAFLILCAYLLLRVRKKQGE